MLFKKSPAVPESLADQVATATVTASMYVAAFETAATGLEQTANELDVIRDAASQEATRLLAVKMDANELAFKHRSQAQKIRDLLL